MQRALAFKRRGGPDNLDRALIENAAASFHLQQARHTRYLARVENNIGSILMQLERHEEALDHLNRAQQIFTTLGDSGSVAQVNETRARVFLAQNRYDDAEQAASAAVTILERGDEQSLFAEALATHGIALARLDRQQEAFDCLSRSAEIAEMAGDRVSSGRTRIIIIEQLQSHLPPTDLFKLYREADERVGQVPDADTAECLRSAARITIAAAQRELSRTIEELLAGGSLKEEVTRYEGQLVKRAMDESGGQVTSAARILGITHQALCEMLKSRHKSLRIKPPRTRRGSPDLASRG